jgi:hypothetical protein
MAFQLSPGVNVSEIDLTTVVPSVATTDGAFAGVFRWGPIGERVLIDSENALVTRFGKPTNFNGETFFTAANFLSYTNRLWVSRAADVTGATPVVSGNTDGANNVVLIADTSNILVGMYLTQCSNASITFGNSSVNTAVLSTISVLSKNSSSVTLSSNVTATQNGVSFYFAHPASAYTAVALEPGSSAMGANGFVANLVNQVVKNDNDYADKDGNFDPDVIYVARFPGDMGNSLRVGICDTAESFNSTIALTGANVAGSGVTANARIEFRLGSNVATIKFAGTTNAAANSVATKLANGDQVLAGNSSINQQYLMVQSVSVGSNASFINTSTIGFSGLDVSNTSNFITIASNPYSNGDIVNYSNTAGNSQITGLTQGINYHVIQANSSGLKLSLTPFGDEIDLTTTSGANSTLVANTTVVRINLEDSYRLRTDFVSNTIDRYWEFFNVVDVAPGQSDFVLANGNTSAQDELHVVVVDDGGKFSGTPGTILEVYRGLSRATDGKNNDGTGNYYKDVINQNSNYIRWANDRSIAPSASALNVVSSSATAPANITLAHGADGLNESSATIAILGSAYDLFQSAEDIDISLVIQGKPIGGTTAVGGRTVNNFQLANYLIDNIVNSRRDCVVLVSPDRSTVLNNVGDEAVDLKAWRGSLNSSSYAIMDSGYKYQYDRYNDVYRWVPLNGDIAGICARTDTTNDAWWSPAGFNRGQIKNLVKLAFNPRKAERDILYSNGINPVVTFPGQGTVLYGDKTLQDKPSAFDRINVRRLFIVLEKAIATAAKYQLFEFNDAFTRAQFRNLVTPYLRTIKGRRGITDFYVVCDDTNNTPQIIDSNQFVGDIYIKPARSINFIQLNFVAVPTGVQFSEVIGKF